MTSHLHAVPDSVWGPHRTPATRVIIESPFAENPSAPDRAHLAYARRCLRDSLLLAEAPFAPHLLYPQVLDDDAPFQRALGLQRAFRWYGVADLCAVYTDLGISGGMRQGIEYATKIGLPIEERSLNDDREPR